MVSLRRISAALLVAGGIAGGPGELRAAALIPPITGELTGQFRATSLPTAPTIRWKLKLTSAAHDGRHAEIELVAAGGRLHATAELDAAIRDGTWKIVDGELTAAAWLALVAPTLGASVAGVIAEGKVELGGGGELKDGRPSGVISLAWKNGALRHPDKGWAIEGISLRGELTGDVARLAAMTSAQPWELAIATIRTARFGARNLAVTAKLNGDGTMSLLAAKIEIAGGEMKLEPAVLPLFPPVLDVTVHVNRVGLQDLVALVPASLADARGRIDGDVRLGWSAAAGIQVGEGSFELRDDEAAMLRLAPSPGLITGSVRSRLPLPSWLGPFGAWLAPKNPVYGAVREIELGRTQLTIESFGLRLVPEGDAQGRTGVAEIAARPEQAGTLVKRVVFDIDLTGSLMRLLKLKAEGATFKAH